MDKVFLDTNVILDYLLARTPFDFEAKRFYEAAELGNIELYASALTICNIAYIVRKIKSIEDFNTIAADLSLLMTITPINETIINHALSLGYKDFEDAVQYSSALNELGLTHFITRNKGDFQQTILPVLTPSQYWGD